MSNTQAHLHLCYRDTIPERFEIWASHIALHNERTGDSRGLIGVFASPGEAFDAARKLHPELMVYCSCPGDFPYRMVDRNDIRSA